MKQTCDMCSGPIDGFYLCEKCVDSILQDLVALGQVTKTGSGSNALYEAVDYETTNLSVHDLVYQGYDRLENEKTAEIDGLEYLKYDRENFQD